MSWWCSLNQSLTTPLDLIFTNLFYQKQQWRIENTERIIAGTKVGRVVLRLAADRLWPEYLVAWLWPRVECGLIFWHSRIFRRDPFWSCKLILLCRYNLRKFSMNLCIHVWEIIFNFYLTDTESFTDKWTEIIISSTLKHNTYISLR